MATGSTEHIDATTAAVFIPTIWSKEAIVAREQALVFAGMVNRVFEKELRMGNTIHVPSVGNLSTQTKDTDANAATVYETVTETNTDITVSTWEYSAIALETFTRVQANRDLLRTYAPKQGYALALAVDDALATLVASISNTVGTLATDLTYENMLRAVQYLDDANAPQMDRAVAISPAQRSGFMKLDQFVNGDYSKLNDGVNAAQKAAAIGSWMGLPISASTNVNGSNAAGHDCVLMQKECMALVVQEDATTHAMFDVDYLAQKVVVEHIHGSAIMRNDHGVYLKGS